ncbi:MAG TPA: hypothetical protein VJ521_07275, partial [Acidobacteriota bacterium]|nr:hypothetical protein [Acidobacteriota bacterium]
LQFNPAVFNTQTIGLFIAQWGAIVVASLLANILALGALTFLISDYLTNAETSISKVFSQMRFRFAALLGTSMLGWLIITGGLILCVVPGLYFFFSYLLATQVVLLEQKSGTAALSRSKELMRSKSEKGFTKSNAFKATVLLLVVGVITYAVQTVTALPQIAYYMYAIFSSSGQADPMQIANSPISVLTELFGVVGYCLTKPLGMIALILLYYDIRSRKEGLDLEIMAESISVPKI